MTSDQDTPAVFGRARLLHGTIRWIPVFAVLLLFAALFQNAGAQGSVEYLHPDYLVEHWGVEEGLPVNSVNNIIQSSGGYLWLATNDGLVRFDGVRFSTYQTGDYPGLPSNRIDNLIEAPDSTLLLETEQQHLVWFDWERFTSPDSSAPPAGPASLVNQLYADGRGRLWAGMESGLNIYRNGQISPIYPEEIRGGVDRIFLQENGVLWYRDSTDRGIYRFTGGQAEKMSAAEQVTDATPFFEDAGGTVWYADADSLYRYGDGELAAYPAPHEVVDITESADTLWLATQGGGFARFQNGEIHETERGAGSEVLLGGSFETGRNGERWMATGNEIYRGSRLIVRSSNRITDFTFDREGNLWIGTFNDGLYQVRRSLFMVYGTEKGLPMEIAYPVLEDEENNLWVGTHGEGIARISDGVVDAGYEFQAPAEGSRFVRSIWQKSDGTLLASLLGGGIFQLRESDEVGSRTFIPYPSPPALQSATVDMLYEDQNGTLYAGSNSGLFVERNGQWSAYGRDDFAGAEQIRTVAEASGGDLWFGTNGSGIVRFDGNGFTSYSTDDGLTSSLVRSIHIEEGERETTLWVGTEDHGLIRLTWDASSERVQEIVPIDRSDGLYDNAIHSIIDSRDGWYWMSTNRGIFRVRTQDLNALARGAIAEVRSISYDEQDGMYNREANGGVFPAGARSEDGRIWFPTQNGVVTLNPENLGRSGSPPQVRIERVTADSSVFTGLQPVSLGAHQRDLSIRYTGLSFTSPGDIRFRYRILELEDRWTEAGTRREAFYTNLPHGRFTFQVSAANKDGEWNNTPAELAITIAPRFYETGIFYALCLLMLGGLAFGTLKWRTRRLEQTERRLKEEVNRRTRALRTEKRKTEQQAEELKELDRAKSRFFANISHEFRTPLTLILNPVKQLLNSGSTLNPAERDKLEMTLRNGQRLMRLINQMLDIVRMESGQVKLELEEMDMADFSEETLAMFQPLADQQNITLRFHSRTTNSNVRADYRKMEQVLGNLLANALKFTPTGGSITLKVNEKEAMVHVSVEDTGIGIPADQINRVFDRFYQVESPDSRNAEGMGIGLALCREVAELHGGTLTASSEEGDGTRMVLSLPRSSSPTRPDTSGGSTPAPEQVDVRQPDGRKEDTPYRRPLDRENILVVEDNRDMRNHICSVLEERFHTHTAKNGLEALEIIAKKPPDLIVADIMMPKMDGLDFSVKLREDPLHRNIPLLFLTARSTEEDEIRGLREGADDYLTKPFKPQVLEARITSLLQFQKRLRNKLLQEGPSEAENETGDGWLGELNRTISRHLSDPAFGVAELADALHMERSQLYRRCNKLTDRSPQQLLKRARINRARDLIAGGHDNFTEVAYACGFSTLSYFSRSFKKRFGVPPSKWDGEGAS